MENPQWRPIPCLIAAISYGTVYRTCKSDRSSSEKTHSTHSPLHTPMQAPHPGRLSSNYKTLLMPPCFFLHTARQPNSIQ